MSQLHPLITDLALILILAAITSLIFKKLKQPVVLGYIVAGFLASPHFSLLPDVSDVANVNIWGEIGIIVLLFSLGLEFNFKKLLNVGGSALITTLVIVTGMMLLGYATGRILRFSYLDSIFLGSMLSMSSTTIIIKAFTDLGLQKQKFATLVFGVLIVEDLFAVLSMVLLTSIAVKREFEGVQLLQSVLKLAFFLIAWFGVGTFLIPTFLKRIKKFLNAETLLIVSMALCLGMVVLANYVGFSSALGAFIMGSILAGTLEEERISKEIRPVRDLFGAVFFISVGMLVNPHILVEYAGPIILISLVVIVGQIVCGTCGMLLSGQPLDISVKSGFSLAQIGEFAFIIASLGMSLKVIDSVIYPVIVAVSIITTFTTPYLIRLANPAIRLIEKKLPSQIKLALENYSHAASARQGGENLWKLALRKYLLKLGLYSILLTGITGISLTYFIPFLASAFPSVWAQHIGVVLTILVMAPLLWNMSVKRIKDKTLSQLWKSSRSNHVPLISLLLFRIVLALFFIIYFLGSVYSQRMGVLAGLIVIVVVTLLFSRKLQRHFTEIEQRFLSNLNARDLQSSGLNKNLVRNMHLATMEVSPACSFTGRTLSEVNLRKQYGINVASIKRGAQRINIPAGNHRLFPGDVISVVGTDEQIRNFSNVVESDENQEEIPEEYVPVVFEKIILPTGSKMAGKSLKESGIRDRESCLVVAVERNNGTFLSPDGNVLLNAGDILWLVGEKSRIDALLNN